MTTKVQQKSTAAMVPAGILEGTEAFWIEEDLIDRKWLIYNRQSMRYSEAPVKVQNQIAMMFLNDTRSRNYLKNVMGITAFSKAFEIWYKCIVGALDGTPDFVNGKLVADSFNSACKDMDCVHRGKFCGVAAGLKYYQVSTLSLLKQGFKMKDVARKLYQEESTIKSRVEVLKVTLEAKNMAHLIAIAVEIGI